MLIVLVVTVAGRAIVDAADDAESGVGRTTETLASSCRELVHDAHVPVEGTGSMVMVSDDAEVVVVMQGRGVPTLTSIVIEVSYMRNRVQFDMLVSGSRGPACFAATPPPPGSKTRSRKGAVVIVGCEPVPGISVGAIALASVA
jgi:hypothetical protein